jgi:hypothetical protein
MPTVLRVGRFRFFFYASDRAEAAHVHVEAGSGEWRGMSYLGSSSS